MQKNFFAKTFQPWVDCSMLSFSPHNSIEFDWNVRAFQQAQYEHINLSEFFNFSHSFGFPGKIIRMHLFVVLLTLTSISTATNAQPGGSDWQTKLVNLFKACCKLVGETDNEHYRGVSAYLLSQYFKILTGNLNSFFGNFDKKQKSLEFRTFHCQILS